MPAERAPTPLCSPQPHGSAKSTPSPHQRGVPTGRQSTASTASTDASNTPPPPPGPPPRLGEGSTPRNQRHTEGRAPLSEPVDSLGEKPRPWGRCEELGPGEFEHITEQLRASGYASEPTELFGSLMNDDVWMESSWSSLAKALYVTGAQWRIGGWAVPRGLTKSLVETCMWHHEESHTRPATRQELIQALNFFTVHEKLRRVELYCCLECGASGPTFRSGRAEIRHAPPAERWCRECWGRWMQAHDAPSPDPVSRENPWAGMDD